jgi:hypothetical protein
MARWLRIGGRVGAYGVGTHPGIHHRDRGPAIAIAEIVSGCGEPDPERAIAGRLRL